jgi:hypothetical protein
MTPTVVVSIHDVAPATVDASKRWLEMTERHGMVASLLVIPGEWRGHSMSNEPEFAEWLHRATARGHEVVLHGWEHRAVHDPSTSLMRRAHAHLRARGCAEFAALQPNAARHLLQLGMGTLARHGFRPEGFVPPGWMALRSTDEVLREFGFAYTTTQWEVRDLRAGVSYRIPSTSQRPGSVFTTPAARAMVITTRRFAQQRRPIRIALHPDDLRHPVLYESTETMLSALSEAGFRSVTYATLRGTLKGRPEGAMA